MDDATRDLLNSIRKQQHEIELELETYVQPDPEVEAMLARIRSEQDLLIDYLDDDDDPETGSDSVASDEGGK